MYLVYDQELLGPSEKTQAVLQKAEEVVPPAVYGFSQYVCDQTGLKVPQVPGDPSAAKAWREVGVPALGWPLRPCLVSPEWGRVLLCLPPGWRGWGRASLHQPLPPLSSQLPAPPKFNFHLRDSWNSGRPGESLCLGGPQTPPSSTPTLLPGRTFLLSPFCSVRPPHPPRI